MSRDTEKTKKKCRARKAGGRAEILRRGEYHVRRGDRKMGGIGKKTIVGKKRYDCADTKSKKGEVRPTRRLRGTRIGVFL